MTPVLVSIGMQTYSCKRGCAGTHVLPGDSATMRSVIEVCFMKIQVHYPKRDTAASSMRQAFQAAAGEAVLLQALSKQALHWHVMQMLHLSVSGDASPFSSES